MIYNGYNRRLERRIINHQTGRRNLTKSQLVKAYAMVEKQIAEEAKTRKESNLKQNTETSNLTARNVGETAEVVAKKIGVSKNTYKGMKQIVSEGTPEQIKRMDKGGKGNGVSAIVAEIKEEKEQERKTTYQKSEKSSMPTMNTAKVVRNLTRLKPAIAKKAKERMMAGKSNPDQKSGQGKTDRQLAKIAGVSHDTIHRVEVRIGELLKQIPKAQGKRTDITTSFPEGKEVKPKSEAIKESGITPKQATGNWILNVVRF